MLSIARKLERKPTIQQDVLALVMAGGRGSRMGALTTAECKPALSFAGIYRNIDFTLSNCINSGIRRVAILTQYNAQSLLQHIAGTWGFLSNQLGEFIDLWPAQQRTDDNWYLGTANAIQQNRDLISQLAPEYTIVLAGDHVYKMDYSELLDFHKKHDADITVACIEVPLQEGSQLGVISVDNQHLLHAFQEKPKQPFPVPGCPEHALASMGIYVFKTDFLLNALACDADNPKSSHDFGHDILPWAVKQPGMRVYGYPFFDPRTGKPAYWRDVGTVDSYWRAQMDLLDPDPELDLYDSSWPIIGASRINLPTRLASDRAGRPSLTVDSLVGPGCLLRGAKVDHCVLSEGVSLDSNALVENSVLLANAHIGCGCRLNRVIVESGCQVPDGVEIDGARDGYLSTSTTGGVVLVNEQTLLELQGARVQVA